MIAGLTAWGQAASPQRTSAVSFDLAASYTVEHSQQAPDVCGCFWMTGGSMDFTATLWKGWGLALAVNGEHASAATAGSDLNSLRTLIGPRFLARSAHVGARRIPVRVFGEALFGRVYGFESLFPTPNGVVSSSNAMALQAGGGINVQLSKHFGVRALQVDFVRTDLPNNASNVQSDVSASWGATYHFGK